MAAYTGSSVLEAESMAPGLVCPGFPRIRGGIWAQGFILLQLG